MPVGISFENSSLKASFSLSSLPATETTPDKCVKARQFNSLTKNRVKATAVRRSWGSTASDHREEFWSVLQANYNYIMDNQLIDKCQEVDGDLTINTGTWTLKEFYNQFSELYSWLNSVQETIYCKEENITDKALRAHCVNMVLEKSSSLKLFNDQASQLVQSYPEVQEEVAWRSTHLNSKWDSILSILGPSDCDHCDQDSCLDIDHELKCLRKWFKVMESRLQPLDFRAKYTKTEIETKALELNVLHRDIENHGKIVGSVVKLCKKSDARCNTVNIRRIANGLERRWHLLFLRSLEWQCYLESLSKRPNLRNSTSSESDSDCYKEPANKYPRLSGSLKEGKSDRHFDYSSSEDDSAGLTNDSVMTEITQRKDIEDSVDGNFMKFGEDTSHFTKSNRKGPNLATYYFKHEDTDSDMDKVESYASSSKMDGQSTLEETSEEEWTYTKSTDVEMNGINSEEKYPTTPKAISEETIKRLVQQAEELVSPDKSRKIERSSSLHRMSRINHWLSRDKPDDSCDASGEDDEKESQTSEEEFDASTMTLRQGYGSQNTSFNELHSPEDNENGHWCRSYMSELNQATSSPAINTFSISESALHKISFAPKSLDRFHTVSTNNFMNCTNSTSSTVEEISPLLTEKSSPARRKKSKLKKKSMFGKSDTYLLHSPPSSHRRNLLIKSGSFSGYSSQKSQSDRNVSSDPPQHTLFSGKYETSTTSGADSDDDRNRRMIPHFIPGLRTQYLNNITKIRDDSPGKSSLNTTEEQSSSLSEAWDNYQENYLSEPYSESHDSDAARKLLEFGEDYRNFIDSPSDCSAFSDISPTMKRRVWPAMQYDEDDSNTDEESLKQLINNSQTDLNKYETIYNRIKLKITNGLVTSDIEELVSRCDHHIKLLSQMNESCDEYKMSEDNKRVTTDMLQQWKNLKSRCFKYDEYKKLEKQINDLKSFIISAQTDVRLCLPQDIPHENIQNEIDICKKLLEAIKTHGLKLASLNAVVHRFTLENQDSIEYANCSLKSDISDLYEMFDGARTRTQDKLKQIENLMPEWTTLEIRLEQLQKDLVEDKKTIHLLDSVLTNGTFTDQTASCVRDVAKLLSETNTYQGYPFTELFTEGSFSDSGISDEGSEHDIGERQGRLAAIRRLVRQLEVGLSPDSKARLLMKEKLDAVEAELKALQLHCRSLIVRTAACSTTTSERISQQQKDDTGKKATKSDDPEDDPDNDPPESWLKRTWKASLAFQIVFLTFVCLSCFFEPQCCDHMNNYSWTLSPKLHYEGRPPI